MHHARLAATLATALVTALLLVGCTDDPEPKVEPSETPSSTSVSTTDPRQLERELIANFVAGVSVALSSGNPDEFLALSEADCQNCQTLARNLRMGYRDGGRIVGGSWKVSKIRLEQGGPPTALWYVDVRSTRESWLNSQGDEIKVVEAGVQLLAFELSQSEEGPFVADLRVRG